jgi:hypothetical protein
MKIKYLLAFGLFFAATISLFAQEEEEPKKGFDKSRLFVSGTLGLSFGDYTYVNISPQVGYQFNRYLAAGAGINGIYSSDKYNDGYGDKRTEYGVIGLNIFGRVYPIQYAFLQLQPEANYVWRKDKIYNNGTGTDQEFKQDPRIVPSVLAGLGAAIPAGRGALLIMAQYDLIQDFDSPYSNNVFFSFGFNFGL